MEMHSWVGVLPDPEGWRKPEYEELIYDTARTIGMIIIAGPNVYYHKGLYTALAVIAESHIIAHELRVSAKGKVLHMNMMSCRAFDKWALREYLVEELGSFLSEPEMVSRIIE